MLDYQKVLEGVKDLAVKVGEYQKEKFLSSDFVIESKKIKIDLVTEVDKKSEEMLIEYVSSNYPDHAILAEESGQHDKESDYLWIIDPLDGTINFSKGLPIFSISIALQYKDEIVLGIVYAPILNQMFEAVKGNGAFLNGKKLSISSVDSISMAIIGTGFPYDRATSKLNNANNVSHFVPKVAGLRRMGSAAYDLASVAAGHLDGYWEMCLNLWDCAAGMLLVSESGGEIIHFRNDRNISIIAANKTLATEIKSELDYVDKQ